jgi:DNA-binding transcriptional ArsR family regulator
MTTLSRVEADRIAMRAHALADATRVRIVGVLARSDSTVGRIAVLLASEPSTTSKHLQVLFRAGLVTRRRDASTVIYSIADRSVLSVCRYLGRRRVRDLELLR